MEPHIRAVLNNKRVKLFGRLLQEFSYPDAKIADEMASGFPLCGWLPASGVFPAKVRTPEINETFLRKMARSFSARSIAATVSTGDDEADLKLWQATLDEVTEGFLSGPYDAGELGSESVVSPRFGLQQKLKLRPIDNFSASHVNSATGLQERFVVDTVDEICAMVKAWMQRAGGSVSLVGKTMVRLLFQSLGWELSKDEEKDKPFAAVFNALGVEFDLSHTPDGWFTVGNTEARKAELREKIQHILDCDELEPRIAESLRSRLLFADAQLFGRFSKIALHRIGEVGLRSRTESPLSSGVKSSLDWMLRRVLTDAPRRVDTGGRPTYFLFLDGACTDDVGTSWNGTSIGAVLADSSGNVLRFFGHVVHKDLVSTWGPPGKTQHIFEAEILPYAISLLLWPDILHHCCIFAFIDNEAAKASWISGYAGSVTASAVIHNGAVMEADRDIHPFFARVPTTSNLGDDPSRGHFERLLQMGAIRTEVTDSMVEDVCTLPLSESQGMPSGAKRHGT
eukprot:s675_g1.t1